jgi:UDP-GlcNAc:undecaprenyl-phosphate GlcNAc-1-phosphate transferase
LLRGQSPFIGGRDHTTHHLSYLGLSDRGVALVLLTLNAIFTGLAVFMILDPNQTIINHWLVGIIALLVGITLYAITKISKPKK